MLVSVSRLDIGVESFMNWRRRIKPVSEPASARVIPRFNRTTLPVPAPYLPLYQYLDHRYATMVVLTFEQIEALVGASLPALARTEPEWWTGAAVTEAHSSAWTHAGRTALPNLLAKTVTFERQS